MLILLQLSRCSWFPSRIDDDEGARVGRT